MAVFKINPDSYKNQSCILNTLIYIQNPQKSVYNGSNNMFIPYTENTAALIQANQFLYIKNFYRKQSGKQIEHFILSFDTTDEEKKLSLNTMINIANRLSYCLLEEYQVVFSIHKPNFKNPNYHIHFIMNSVSLNTGKHFRLNKSNFNSFMDSIANFLKLFHIALRGYSYTDKQGFFHKGEYNGLSLYGETMNKYKYYKI